MRRHYPPCGVIPFCVLSLSLVLLGCGSDDSTSRPLDESATLVSEAAKDAQDLENLPEDESCEETIEEKSINEVIGVGGGAGGKFAGRRSKKARRAGGRATPATPSHGGSDLVNDEAYDLQFFKSYGVNPFVDTDDDALSTFAADVDTGAFTICRKFIDDGHIPKSEAVRVEEFVNYFDYGYAPPREGTFEAHIAGGPSPFAPNRHLLSIGIKGREIDAASRKDAMLTFVIDVSGSMNRQNRLQLVKRALRLLVEELRPSDEIGIAVYGSEGRAVLRHTPISEGRDVILDAIDELCPGGSTNAEEGLRIGYDMAGAAYRPGWINRVILCSDGVANVGSTGPDSIYKVIEEHVKRGICLTAVGFGMDNYNDILMERLGDKGNGHYAYVDGIDEARRVFVEGITGTLQVIARDVKIQVEFDPRVVRSYRLVGYENRKVADNDFRNDVVDGGEVGAGHTVTAVYEIKLWDSPPREAPIGWLRIRYKDPDYVSEVAEFQREISGETIAPTTIEGTFAFRLASCVTQFAEILRKSYWATGTSLAGASEEAASLAGLSDGDKKITELVRLVDRCEILLSEPPAAK